MTVIMYRLRVRTAGVSNLSFRYQVDQSIMLILATALPAGYRINPSPPPPPLTLQSFGPGAPPGSAFQYSKCTGRRRALLIGINYLGQRGQLAGCINDVTNMLAYLTGYFGYKREHVVVLTDDQQRPTGQPTKQNILRAMHWLVEDARPDDSLFFHFSGSLTPTHCIFRSYSSADCPRSWRADRGSRW